MVHPRVGKELEKMASHKNPDINILYRSENNENFILELRGPSDSCFEGAYFKIHCHIGPEYPFKPPEMSFMTKIWHPNISSVTGCICLDTLKDAWTPAMNIETAMLCIQAMLTMANLESPQDWEVADMYKENFELYQKKAREWVELYAKRGMGTEKEEKIQIVAKKYKDVNKAHSVGDVNDLDDPLLTD